MKSNDVLGRGPAWERVGEAAALQARLSDVQGPGKVHQAKPGTGTCSHRAAHSRYRSIRLPFTGTGSRALRGSAFKGESSLISSEASSPLYPAFSPHGKFTSSLAKEAPAAR